MYISDNMYKGGFMGEFNQAKYIQEYQKEKYDRCIFNVPKGQKKVIQAHYEKLGFTSLNQYINELVRKDMNESAPSITVGDINNQGVGNTINIG